MIDHENKQVGVVEKYLAIGQAREVGLDLVEVAPQSDPPVCRIMDYGKWLYEQKRKVREGRKKSQHQMHLGMTKEVRLRPETDKHDVEIKLGHAREFLEKGYKVQFTMMFHGRQMLHKELAVGVLDEIIKSLEDKSVIEQPGKMANRRMILVLAPKTGK